jgi:glycosyltransferase involved in cell wall biosynthesis
LTHGRRIRGLYLCYFGIEQPLVQTQVLPYLQQLQARGVDPTILTFEPLTTAAWRRDVASGWIDRLRKAGIGWEWLPYHKRPSVPATAYDVMRGAWRARQIVRRDGMDVLHARSYVPAVMGVLAKRATGARLIFDVRGLMAEEYVHGGVWPAGGWLFRWTKRAERWLMDASDGFVVLTDRGREAIFPGSADGTTAGRPVEVIPCCVDVSRFTVPDRETRAAAKARLGVAGRRIVAHIGALDGWVLTDATAGYLAAACRRDPDTIALVLTPSPSEGLRRAFDARGLGADRYIIRTASPDAVPGYLHAVDVGLALYKSGYAKICSSPTKIAEYLASGVPIVTSSGIGDVEDVIVADRTGVVTASADDATIERVLTEVEILERDPDTPARCRRSAEARFHLEHVAGLRYRRLYQRVLESHA